MPEFRDTPVVMMTGVSDEKQMQEAAANGANSYTIKPANAEQFLRTVLASTTYWLTIHQYPEHHLPADAVPAVKSSVSDQDHSRRRTCALNRKNQYGRQQTGTGIQRCRTWNS